MTFKARLSTSFNLLPEIAVKRAEQDDGSADVDKCEENGDDGLKASLAA